MEVRKIVDAENQNCNGQIDVDDTTFWTEAQSSLIEILRIYREKCLSHIQVCTIIIYRDVGHIMFFRNVGTFILDQTTLHNKRRKLFSNNFKFKIYFYLILI
jgi:hypothetical protein